MGVKSTRRLSHATAVRMAADLHQEIARRGLEALYWAMTDEELEDSLERMNDRRCGGEGFENYIIERER